MKFESLPWSNHALVELRPIVATDIPVWFGYLTDRAVYEHTSWNVQSPDDLAEYVWSEQTREPTSLTRFAIALRATGEFIGTAGFHSVAPYNRTAELAYDLAAPHWGQGIGTHVCGLLTEWAHQDCGVLRVQATTLRSNERSARVLARCGFEREGLVRSYRMVRGTPGDFWLYAHVVPLAAGHSP